MRVIPPTEPPAKAQLEGRRDFIIVSTTRWLVATSPISSADEKNDDAPSSLISKSGMTEQLRFSYYNLERLSTRHRHKAEINLVIT
jgi:hypothetical protein